MNRMYQPIPLLNGVNGWQQVRIQECGEPLVSLNQLSGRILIRPAYALQGIPHALDDMYLREGAAGKLARAAMRLKVRGSARYDIPDKSAAGLAGSR
jgi:hypothetical protein